MRTAEGPGREAEEDAMTDRPVISTTALAVELCGSEQHGDTRSSLT
jgi:hypothetical protein